MNWVPLFFFDAVCHQLDLNALPEVGQLSGGWSKFGAEHGEKRREFVFSCKVDEQTFSYHLRDKRDYSSVFAVGDLDVDHDRITSITWDPPSHAYKRVSLDKLQLDILPTVALHVTKCYWSYLDPKRRAQNQIFFNAFKNCLGFNEICVQEQGEESRQFVARQVELGNVEKLSLGCAGKWPEPEKLAETLRTFVNSTRFHQLIIPGGLRNYFELFALFLERALADELKKGAYIRVDKLVFDENRLSVLHPECRVESEEVAWCVPNSSHRITVKHDRAFLAMEIC